MQKNLLQRPEPSLQRKASLAHGGALEHTGAVRVEPIAGFDLNRTIFKTLEGRLPRFVVRTRVGTVAKFEQDAARAIERAYANAGTSRQLPPISPELMRFLKEECDFDVEHADGSFLEHLYFCFEYAAAHYPSESPLVLFLHSILGTGTNTFAIDARKAPQLRRWLSPQEWIQIEAFPSVLRLPSHRCSCQTRAGSDRQGTKPKPQRLAHELHPGRCFRTPRREIGAQVFPSHRPRLELSVELELTTTSGQGRFVSSSSSNSAQNMPPLLW